MLYYLDTVVVIYAVEGNPADQQRTVSHLAGLEQTGHRFVISDLSRTECLVPVLGPGAGQRLSDFFRFFHSPTVRTVPLTAATYARAAAIRGSYFSPRRTHRLSRGGTAWWTPSTSPRRSSPAATAS